MELYRNPYGLRPAKVSRNSVEAHVKKTDYRRAKKKKRIGKVFLDGALTMFWQTCSEGRGEGTGCA